MGEGKKETPKFDANIHRMAEDILDGKRGQPENSNRGSVDTATKVMPDPSALKNKDIDLSIEKYNAYNHEPNHKKWLIPGVVIVCACIAVWAILSVAGWIRF